MRKSKGADSLSLISFTGRSLGGGIASTMSLWFDRASTTFSSPAGKTTMAHARTFLAEITAFLVEERRAL